ncbi:hypothetical protein SDC9_182410 [bioreactor metagenome]|uniref:Uncharacterized protein n=1 Tax=bioreactor metagenome TaxID=1076179 RepID=A0A645H8S6_9ZZZZ
MHLFLLPYSLTHFILLRLFIPQFLLAVTADAMKSQTMVFNHELIARLDIFFDLTQQIFVYFLYVAAFNAQKVMMEMFIAGPS